MRTYQHLIATRQLDSAKMTCTEPLFKARERWKSLHLVGLVPRTSFNKKKGGERDLSFPQLPELSSFNCSIFYELGGTEGRLLKFRSRLRPINFQSSHMWPIQRFRSSNTHWAAHQELLQTLPSNNRCHGSESIPEGCCLVRSAT